MRNNSFVIAVAQIAPKLGDLSHNLELHIEQSKNAAQLGAELIVFPELSLTGYLLKDLTADVAQNVQSSELLERIARLSEQISILIGFVEEADDYIYYNSAALFEDGKLTALHRKVYLPTYGMFDEGRYFSAGSCFRAFESRFGRAAILICEDYWHASSVYLAAQDGAVLHFYLANAPYKGMPLPDDVTSTGIAESMAQISSQLYGVYTVYVNRVGCEDGISFTGRSKVISPMGAVISRAGTGDAELLLAEIEPEQVRRSRVFSPLMGDEKLDLVHRELTRIRANRYDLDEEE